MIIEIFLQQIIKFNDDDIKNHKPTIKIKMSKFNAKDKNTIFSGGMNIESKDNKHAITSITPVLFNKLSSGGKMLFVFSFLINVFPLAPLNKDIDAKTNPNKIPATVARGPAAETTSSCFISGRCFAIKVVSIEAIINIKILLNLFIIDTLET